MKKHDGELPYKYSYCIFFAKLSTSGRHFQTHTGKKSYLFSFCNKIFSSNNNFASNFETLSDDYPYKCSQCSNVCRDKLCLLHTLRAHIWKNLYQCTQCGFTCNKKSSLLKYLGLKMRYYKY